MKIRRDLPKKTSTHAADSALSRSPSRIARQLALAYKIERMIEAGELRDYADAARRLGVSRARMTHVMDLMLRPVWEQEEILIGS